MKHAMDNPLRQHYAISQQQLLAALGISRQAYHQQRQRQQRRAAREALALEIVRQIRQHHPRMGTRKLHHLLKERHCAIGREVALENHQPACRLESTVNGQDDVLAGRFGGRGRLFSNGLA